MKKCCECMEIKNATETSADLYFYGDIVSDWWGAWQEEDQYPEGIKNFLSEQNGKDLNVYINSGGGSVFAGIAIYNMLKRHTKNNRVTIHVDGLAGSIASVIAFAGSEKPKIPANAFLMIHNPWTDASGNAVELRKVAEELDLITTGILNIYKENLREGVSVEKIKELMDAETWMNGEQASEYFEIEVEESREYVAAVGMYMNSAQNMPPDIKNIQKQAGFHETKLKRDSLKRLVARSLLKEE